MLGMFDFKKMHLPPENYLACLDEKDGKDYLYIMPIGASLNNEMSDVHYQKGANVVYHVHSSGYETFTIDRGSVQVTICGKQCIVDEGDMLHIMPYVPHGFTMLEEGTIWRELFSQIDMNHGIMNKRLLEKDSPEMLEDADFMAEYRSRLGTVRPGEPVVEKLDKTLVPQVRVKGSALKEFRFGYTNCKLKVGRWELGGEKEIWEYTFDEPCTLEWNVPHHDWDLFVVLEGRVQVEAARETFIAKKRDIINIPPYTRHKITILDSGTVLQDNNCKFMALNLFENLNALQTNNPAELECKDTIQALFKTCGCALSAVSKIC